MRISTFPVICWTRQSNLFLSEFIFSYHMINLPYISLRIAFRVSPISCLTLALYSSVPWVLLKLPLLAGLCKTDCQCIILKIASANWLDKTWVPLFIKWSFDVFRCLTVIVFPWIMKWRFFSRDLPFKYLFTSAAFHRYLFVSGCDARYRYITVFFILAAKLMIFSAIYWGSYFVVTSFVPTWSITWLGVFLV